DIQILRMLGELRDEALLREVHHNNPILNFKIFRDTASYLNQCDFPPGHQYHVDSRGRDLSRELSPYSRRGAGNQRPRPKAFFADVHFHLVSPFNAASRFPPSLTGSVTQRYFSVAALYSRLLNKVSKASSTSALFLSCFVRLITIS